MSYDLHQEKENYEYQLRRSNLPLSKSDADAQICEFVSNHPSLKNTIEVVGLYRGHSSRNLYRNRTNGDQEKWLMLSFHTSLTEAGRCGGGRILSIHIRNNIFGLQNK